MPRTEEQFREMREKSKKLIVDTAMDLFSRQGFHSTSMQKIAKEAGIAVGLVYNYFESKEALLDEIIQSGIREVEHLLHHHVQTADVMTKEGFAQLLTVFCQIIRSKIEIWRLFVKISLEPEVAPIAKSHIENNSSHMDHIFCRYFEQHGFKEPQRKAQVLNAMLHGAFLSYILQRDDQNFDLMIQEIIEKFV